MSLLFYTYRVCFSRIYIYITHILCTTYVLGGPITSMYQPLETEILIGNSRIYTNTVDRLDGEGQSYVIPTAHEGIGQMCYTAYYKVLHYSNVLHSSKCYWARSDFIGGLFSVCGASVWLVQWHNTKKKKKKKKNTMFGLREQLYCLLLNAVIEQPVVMALSCTG